MKYKILSNLSIPSDSSATVFSVFEEDKNSHINSKISQEYLKKYPDSLKLYQTQLLIEDNQTTLLVGIGKKEKLDYLTLQNWVGVGVKALAEKHSQISLILPDVSNFDILEAAVIGSELALFDPSLKYKSTKKSLKLDEVVFITKATGLLKNGLVLSEAINLARSLGDTPSNDLTPTLFLNTAKKIARENNLKLTIVDEKKALKMGMGAFNAVAAGSSEPSYIITLEYRGAPSSKEKFGLVGKGVTFDTGGISIKPSASMHEMKYDMCGAGSVLGAMLAISKLKLKQNVVGVMALTENMLTGKALKPGDVLKTYSGKTIEVLNTDAEGRLILFDAIAYAQKDFKVTKIVDLATLTGAVIVALGDFYTGAFSNNPNFCQEVIKAGTLVGEKVWELPMSEDYNPMIESDIADYTNLGHGGSMGERTAGSITGAKLIEMAVEKDTPWIHLDIAGTAWDLSKKPYRAPGATGVGIKTLVQLLSNVER